MSDVAWASIAQMVVVVGGLIALLLKLRDVRNDITEVKDNVHTIEKATNSMKDALIKSTGEASFAAGADSQRATEAQAVREESDRILARARLEAASLITEARRVAADLNKNP